MIPFEWLERARARIEPYVLRTPLTTDAGRDLHFKWENRQRTGSFKARGAFNKVLGLEPWEREAGLVAVSAGNHGQGVALAAQLSRTTVQVFVPQGTVRKKVDAMRALGAEVIFVQGGYGEAEIAGRDYATTHAKTWISPYDDGQVIAGQGTIALEALEQLAQDVSTWVVPVGGGGLISGIGAGLKHLAPHVRLVGVQSEASAFAYNLFHRGTQAGVADLPSLADGLAGSVAEDSVTIPVMRDLLDDFVLVSEADIGRAMAFAWTEYGETIEGSSATALAALLTRCVQDRPALAVITGGNVQPDTHAALVARYAESSWS